MASDFHFFPAQNDGSVKINNGDGLLPRWDDSSAESINNQWQQVTYATPLGLSAPPTTSWPPNVETPTDADVYDFANDTFLENPVLGQVHRWRLQLEFNKVGGGGTRVQVQILNTLSGFEIQDLINLPGPFDEGGQVVVFTTIADESSLPAPLGTGQGYQINIMADNNNLQSNPGNFLEVVSLTRFSAHYANRG